MPKRARWALRAATGLLFLAGYMALASVQGFGSILLGAAVLVLVLSPFAERLDRAAPGYRTISKALTIAYFCFIPLTVLELGLLNGVVALIIFIQFHTMLHAKEEKSYYHIFLMSFFLLLAACTESPEASIGFVLAIFLIATIWAFFSLRVAHEAEESQSHVPADIIRFGEEPLRQIHDDRDPFDYGIAAYLFTIAAVAMVLTLGIFFAMPRVEAGILGRSNGTAVVTGVPDRVRLQSGQTIQQDYTPVLRAEFPESPNGRTTVYPLYWRITSLAKFDGAGWSHAPLDRSGEPGIYNLLRTGWHEDPNDIQRRRRPGARLEHQVIYMDEIPKNGVPALDLVQRIALTGEPRGTKLGWDNANDLTIVLTQEGSRQMHYEAWSEVDEPNIEDLRQDEGSYDDVLSNEDFNLLTEQGILPTTQETVKRITATATTRYDKVAALQAYLSGRDFVYSFTVPALPDEHAIDMFINRTRTGHCELFATALAQMVRSLGIPARAVSGYKGGEYGDNDGAFIVRRSMAHLWVEVLFPSYGWVKFDPTPQSAQSENPGLFEQLRMTASLYALRARMAWFQNVVGYQGRRFLNLQDFQLKMFGEIRQLQAQLGEAAAAGTLARTMAIGAIAIGLFISLAWLGYRRFTDAESLRRTGMGNFVLTQEQRRATRVFRALRRKLRRGGFDTSGCTAEELLAAVAATDWAGKEEAQRLLHAYNDVRFGGRALPSQRLRELWRNVRALRPRKAKA